MATTDHQYQQNIHTSDNTKPSFYGRYQDTTKSPYVYNNQTNKPYNRYGYNENNNGATSKVVGLLALLPVGGTLLLLSGLTFVATVVGLALATPLFVIFSPVLVPAALAIALAIAGFVTSGAFGVSSVAALTWMVQYVRGAMPEALDRMEDAMDYVGQRTKNAGQVIQNKAHDNEYYGREGVKNVQAGECYGREGVKNVQAEPARTRALA